MAFIRPYHASDKDAMIHIFRETAAPGLSAAGETSLHYASFLWCRPYLMLQPDTCFVLDDGTGRAVGYLLGVPDTRAFVRKYHDDYVPYLKSQGLDTPPPSAPPHEQADDAEFSATKLRHIMFHPEDMLHASWPRLLQDWPAHLHIDLLPSHQSHGWGQRMIRQFVDGARQHGVKGIHLGMVATNDGAGRFYARLGFERFPLVIDDGSSGELGRSGNTIWMVKSL